MNPLSQLRDIHLPQGFGFWPLAIGWYVLGLLILLTAVLIGWAYKKRQRRLLPRKEARTKLKTLKERYQRDQDAVAIAIELSMLLRRAALAAFPAEEVASLHDQQWLGFLDKMGDTSEFTRGVGQVLVSAPYQRQAAYQVDELFILIERWIEHNLTRSKVTS